MQLPLPSTAVRLPGNFSESALQFPSSRDNHTPPADKDRQREEQEAFKLGFPTAPWPSSWASSDSGHLPSHSRVWISLFSGRISEPSTRGSVPTGSHPLFRALLTALPRCLLTPPQLHSTHSKSPQQPTAPQSNLWFEFKQQNQSKSKRIKTIQPRKSRIISSFELHIWICNKWNKNTSHPTQTLLDNTGKKYFG